MYAMASISSLLDRSLPSMALMLANLGFPGFWSASICKAIDQKNKEEINRSICTAMLKRMDENKNKNE